MKRGTPMRRTGFRRPNREQLRAGPLPRIERFSVYVSEPLRRGTYATAGTQPDPKREYVRSRPLLDAVRHLACCGCGVRDGTIVPAHSNWEVHGKGGHIKADDNRIAALCMACHDAIDQGSKLLEIERQLFWWQAHVKTVHGLIVGSLWPAGVPIPNTAYCPFLPIPAERPQPERACR
jgi:hypothetical protein